jgi:phosphate starvation-inducible PhoH-like protein
MKTILSRIGENSKYIISGDIDQIDRKNFTSIKQSGLHYAFEKLKDIEGIGLIEFTKDEIVRNPLIIKILDRFNEK